jgi:sugar phosphate isomerase/epimerase
MEIAVNTACYIGQATGYALKPFAWGPARSATVAAFSGPGFAEQFDHLLGTVRSLGVSRVEVWSAHLAPTSTPEMVATATAALRRHDLRVAAYAASLRRPGLTQHELERTFAVATDLGAPLIAGGLHPAYAATVYHLCQTSGVRFALENHPETDPLAILAQIDGREDWFGVAMDTGWFKTHGVDVTEAVVRLQGHIEHCHLKDVQSVGLPHRTCPLGEGVVNVPTALTWLHRIGYVGVLSIEHEPADHDPTADLALSVQRLSGWLAALEPVGGRI